MANVADIVVKIRNAIFGKEIKGSIADGIDAINAEVVSTTAKQSALETTFNALIINAGNSNAEIVAARGVEVDLPTRLNKIDTTLSDMSDYLNYMPINGGGFDGSDSLNVEIDGGVY